MIENQYVAVCAWNTACLYNLTRLGRAIADEQGCMLKILLFVRMTEYRGEQAELLEDVFQCARLLDAEMNVFFTDRPIEKLLADDSKCLVMSGDAELAGLIQERMPEKKLVLVE